MALVASLPAGVHRLRAAEAASTTVARSGWARLITPNPRWDIHADREAMLLRVLEGIPELGYNGEYRRARGGDLEDLCRTPFLFSFDLAMISSVETWVNLREYLYRGGFLYVENCVQISPDLARWRRNHLQRLTRLLPASEWRRLSKEHPVFNTPFKTEMPSIPEDRRRPPEEERAFYGIFDDNRMIVLVSQAQLFCGWPENPGIVKPCQQLLANVYHYSRTH